MLTSSITRNEEDNLGPGLARLCRGLPGLRLSRPTGNFVVARGWGCIRIIGRAEQNPICLGVPHPVQPFQIEGDGGQRELDRYC